MLYYIKSVEADYDAEHIIDAFKFESEAEAQAAIDESTKRQIAQLEAGYGEPMTEEEFFSLFARNEVCSVTEEEITQMKRDIHNYSDF